MKPSVSKKTLAYLNDLEATEVSTVKEPIVYYGIKDKVDTDIYDGGLRMEGIFLNHTTNTLQIELSNGTKFDKPLSDYFDLSNVSKMQLHHFTSDGLSIRWPFLDMDLSLRGFLA